jgi:hypothetical protein
MSENPHEKSEAAEPPVTAPSGPEATEAANLAAQHVLSTAAAAAAQELGMGMGDGIASGTQAGPACPVPVPPGCALLYGEPSFYFFTEQGSTKEGWFLALQVGGLLWDAMLYAGVVDRSLKI